jgi:hypothetical protein
VNLLFNIKDQKYKIKKMRITLKIGILFAFAWMLIKLSIFGMGISSEESLKPSLLINMFLLILAITVGLYLQKRKDTEESNALRDIKNGLSAGVPYAILVSIFIFFYYSKIDPSFTKHKIAESSIELKKVMDNPEKLKKLKETNPDFEVMTNKQITKAVLKNSEGAYNPKSTAIMSLAAMLLYSTLNSVFITIIFRKIVFRKR